MVSNIMAKQEFNRKLVPVACTKALKQLPKTSFLVAENVKGALLIDSLTFFEQSYLAKLHMEW